MNEYEALRREIEVRIQRETTYFIELQKYPKGTDQYESIYRQLDANDKIIALIGKHLLEKYGSDWEKVYQKEFPPEQGETRKGLEEA